MALWHGAADKALKEAQAMSRLGLQSAAASGDNQRIRSVKAVFTAGLA